MRTACGPSGRFRPNASPWPRHGQFQPDRVRGSFHTGLPARHELSFLAHVRQYLEPDSGRVTRLFRGFGQRPKLCGAALVCTGRRPTGERLTTRIGIQDVSNWRSGWTRAEWHRDPDKYSCGLSCRNRSSQSLWWHTMGTQLLEWSAKRRWVGAGQITSLQCRRHRRRHQLSTESAEPAEL